MQSIDPATPVDGYQSLLRAIFALPVETKIEREARVMAFIKGFCRYHGVPVNTRDIVRAGLARSTGSTGPLLNRLARRGLLCKTPRGFVPARQPGDPCPFCGCPGGHNYGHD